MCDNTQKATGLIDMIMPVVASCANAMLRDIEMGLEAGFFRYLTKPIKVDEFMNALDDALKFSEMGLVPILFG